ncbi:isocitrate lyase/PEP mutase family protein [Pseudooceanicola sp. C21-150M6]|uniref:isocitrate lyase/PEP mutase family protein n=1 Tax=Pseudooceanicola sp. C21-150M6 TaxID=3434355 RepID=UPI003D7FE96D
MHDPGPAFRALHAPGNPFVLANCWDVGSARVLAALGAQAIGTSSAGYAFTLGQPDSSLTLEQALTHAAEIVAATPLPVSGDFENGYADDPDDVAETVKLAFEAGLAGISIEDNKPDRTPYDRALAAERIKAAAAAARALPRDFVLVARADGMLNGKYDIEEALARLKAFDEAGADCIYGPIPPTWDDLARIVQSTEKPVNALAAGSFASYSKDDFARIGVARISLGSGFARAAQRRLIDIFSEIMEDGDFSSLKKTVSGAEVDEMLRKFMG